MCVALNHDALGEWPDVDPGYDLPTADGLARRMEASASIAANLARLRQELDSYRGGSRQVNWDICQGLEKMQVLAKEQIGRPRHTPEEMAVLDQESSALLRDLDNAPRNIAPPPPDMEDPYVVTVRPNQNGSVDITGGTAFMHDREAASKWLANVIAVMGGWLGILKG